MRVRMFLWLGAVLLPILLGGALVTPAQAGEKEEVGQVREIKAQLKRLEREMLELRMAGHGEEAAGLQRRTQELRRHLKELLALRERRAEEHSEAEPDKDRGSLTPKRRRAILRGLGQGIEALEALGHKEGAAHLRRIRDEVKRGAAPARAKKEARSEREVVEGWIELMGYGVKVLAKADKRDRAHMLEHGKHALELALAGKRDEEAMRVRKTAPPRESQADCLLLAAEILHDHGDKRHAKLMAELGRTWQKQARERGGRAGREGEERKHADLESLEQRVRILVAALPALREGERKKALAILQRAVNTGRVLLAEREDDEAREILEQTPELGEIAEVLRLAAELWMKFGDKEKARMVAGLAEHYTHRTRAERREAGEEREHEEREHGEHEHGEHEHGERHEEGLDDDEGARDLEQLQDEMQELHAALERMQRQLRKLLKER